MTATLPRCDSCFNFLEFHTDWNGVVIWKHPQVKCVKPDHPLVTGYCFNEDCERPVRGDKPTRRAKTFCSSECRRIVKAKRREAILEAGRRYQAKLRKIRRAA